MDSRPPPPERNAAERPPLEQNIRARSTWLRLFFMIVFIVLYGIAEFVTAVVVVVQFFWVLLTGERNEQLREFGQSLATYTYQIFRYLTYNSERRPFPFDTGWPEGPPRPEPGPEPRPDPGPARGPDPGPAPPAGTPPPTYRAAPASAESVSPSEPPAAPSEPPAAPSEPPPAPSEPPAAPSEPPPAASEPPPAPSEPPATPTGPAPDLSSDTTGTSDDPAERPADVPPPDRSPP